MATRRIVGELMDDPRLERTAHVAALAGLERLNKASRVVQTLGPLVEEVADELGRPVRVLDVASGGGDVAVDLARWAGRRGRSLEVSGCDRSPLAVEFATRRAAAAGLPVRFFVHDVLQSALPGDPDIVMSSLFIHHLSDVEAERALSQMAGAARSLVLVSDLERDPLGLGLAWFATRALTRSPVARTDGPRSVRAAFKIEEILALASRAGLAGARARRVWPRRYLLSWRRA